VADVAWTANTGRAVWRHRAAVVARDAASLTSGLRAIAAGQTSAHQVHGSRAPRVALLCTGQGAQYADVGRALDDTSPVFRAALDACAGMLRDQLDLPLRDVL